MNKEIIIISDLWGSQKSDWLVGYKKTFSKDFSIKFYDACELGSVNTKPYLQHELHNQFVEFGIESAAKELLKLERTPKMYIGCSVGGVIAWKASLLGLPIEKLITISATRLRREIQKPSCPLYLLFGENDQYKPSLDWFDSLNIKKYEFLEGDHEIYKEQHTIQKIGAFLE